MKKHLENYLKVFQNEDNNKVNIDDLSLLQDKQKFRREFENATPLRKKIYNPLNFIINVLFINTGPVKDFLFNIIDPMVIAAEKGNSVKNYMLLGTSVSLLLGLTLYPRYIYPALVETAHIAVQMSLISLFALPAIVGLGLFAGYKIGVMKEQLDVVIPEKEELKQRELEHSKNYIYNYIKSENYIENIKTTFAEQVKAPKSNSKTIYSEKKPLEQLKKPISPQDIKFSQNFANTVQK